MATNYSNEEKNGYLARFQEKLENKPGVKKYTLKDYRNLKKDIEIKAAKDTGKLGFDPLNENYQQKARIEAQKREYAEKVKERNRLLIANKHDESPQLNTNKTVNRPRTISPLEPHENEAELEGKTLVRVRDPITGIIKKLYINDSKQKLLKDKRDMNKVHSFVGHTSRVSVRSDVAQSSNILNEFYQQEHVKIFKDNADYVDFMSNSASFGSQNTANKEDRQILEKLDANNDLIDAETNTEEDKFDLETNKSEILDEDNAKNVQESLSAREKERDNYEMIASKSEQKKEEPNQIAAEPIREVKKEKMSFFSRKK